MNTTTDTSRALMQRIFDGLAEGDSSAFVESLADDFTWHLKGHTSWSRVYRGKQAVLQDLMRPLFRNFASRYTNQALRIIADGEWVAVECRGNVETKGGKRYDNEYCWVCRVQDGRLAEVIEYMDTQLVEEVLSPHA
jgi:ketosteroid isomerase-like protein